MKKIFLKLIICTAIAFTAFSVQAATDAAYKQILKAEEIFHEANALPHQNAEMRSKYLEAAKIYQSVIDENEIENSGLYYNLANSYLFGDEIGHAILNYKRALKLDDSNNDIRKNLEFARSKCITKIETKTREKAAQKVFFWHYYLSAPIKFVVSFIALTVLLWLVILRFCSLKAPGFWGIAAVSFFVFIAFLTSVWFDQYADKHFKEGVVVAESVIARQGDSVSYEKSFEEPLREGVEFEVIENREDWLYVELKNGEKAWLPSQAVELL